MNPIEQIRHMFKGHGITDRIRLAYRRLFSTDDGKIVLEDLCKRYYIFDTAVKNGEDRDAILINEGKRSAVLFILAMINADLELYEHILNSKLEE